MGLLLLMIGIMIISRTILRLRGKRISWPIGLDSIRLALSSLTMIFVPTLIRSTLTSYDPIIQYYNINCYSVNLGKLSAKVSNWWGLLRGVGSNF